MRFQSLFIAATLATTSILSIACGPGKVEQCNSLATVGNKAQNAFIALSAAMLNESSFQTRIEKIDASAKEVKDTKLVDEKLVGMRNRLAEGLESYAKVMKQMKPILKDDKKVDDLNKFIDELNAISDKEGKLIDEINGYCGGTP